MSSPLIHPRPASPNQRPLSSLVPSSTGTLGQITSNAASSPIVQGPNSALSAPRTRSHSYAPSSTIQSNWFPFTLRWYFMLLPISLTLILGTCLICLLIYSRKHNGLGKDDGSSTVLFAWRFAPTLIAVLYTQITVIVFEDVKRTEPFARLAKAPSIGARAYGTILQTPKSWWGISYDVIFKRKKMGKTGWSLVCALLVHIMALLAISPLSSALLASEEVVVLKAVEFTRFSPAGNIQMPMNATRETYLRIMTSIRRNISNSAWSSDSSVTFPFWPSDENPQLGSEILSEYGSWQARTMTYSTDFSCQNMTLEKTELRNRTFLADDWHSRVYGHMQNGTQPMVTYVLNSDIGCHYELSVHPKADIAYYGGVTWSDASTFYPLNEGATITMDGLVMDANVTNTSPYSRLNASEECKGRDIIIVSTPWTAPVPLYEFRTMYPSNSIYRPSPDFRMRALLCESTYTSRAEVMKVSPGLGKQPALERIAEPTTNVDTLPKARIDLEGFQDLSTGDQWRLYFSDGNRDTAIATPEQKPDDDDDLAIPRKSGGASGLGEILGIPWNFIASEMIDDSDLVAEARRIKGRIFSEIVRDSLSRPEMLNNELVPGTVTVVEERIVVLREMAIALCILFLVSFVLLVALFWFSRIERRPLQLHSDPGSTVGLAALLNPHLTSLATLRKLHAARRRELNKTLRSETFRTSSGTLYQGSGTLRPGTSAKKDKKERDWRPRVIHLRNLFALCSFLLLVLATVLILNTFATSSKLYQKAFVYETDLSRFGLKISTFTPISIAPAIISVAITLWWDQVDATFRLLQPYIAMKEPTPIYRGAGLTYRSKTWFGAAIKAAKHQHWLLFMVAMGSTLCQVLTVSMSALFERHMDHVSQQVSLNKTLQMRRYPVITEIDTSQGVPGKHVAMVVDQMFKNSSSSWIYSAVIQITTNGSRPTWTKDEWSFVPLDLQNMNTTGRSDTSRMKNSASNVTISTPAIRVRLDCETVPAIRNVSSWLSADNLDTDLIRNQTGLQNFTAFSRYMFEGTPAYTTMYADLNKVQCCANGTGNYSDPSAFGHWSPANPTRYPYVDNSWPLSFVPKWIVGKPTITYNKWGFYNEVVFVEEPKLQAALCRPVIETADASVLVNQATGTIVSYSLESLPNAYDAAWSEVFLRRSPRNWSRYGDKEHYAGPLNVTTSFGVLFFDALFLTADRANIDSMGFGSRVESLGDSSFNFRDTENGLNMDLMTYSMYTMVGKDPNALLNYTALTTNANRTLQTFFQHFVQNSLSMSTGGYVFQATDDQTMRDIGRAIDANNASISQPVYPAFQEERIAMATVTNRIQILYLNQVATFLSVGILVWLIGTALVILYLQRRYTRSMTRNVELIADVLVLIAGSDNFLSLVQERGMALKRDKSICTKLGWFKGRDGEVRWGVEVVGGRNAVEWVDAPKQGIA